MKKIFITMGSSEIGWSRHNDEGVFRDYQLEAERLMESAKPWGFETIIYSNAFIQNLPYYKDHLDILTKVSFGFAYKAICLYETMKIMENGDIVIWADSNHVVQSDPQIFIDSALTNGVFFRDHIWVYYPQKNWTKRDTFVNMNCDNEIYWNFPQLQDNLLVICKNEKTMKFIIEWKDYCLRYDVMFGLGEYENFPTLIHHRHNQSIFSNLVCKYGFKFLNRTESPIELEFIIDEKDYIQVKNPVDNRYRREEDSKINQ